MKSAASLAPPPPVPSALPLANRFAQHRTLLLNADYQPMGYPLETLSAEDTIKGLFLNRFVIVEQSDLYAHSPSLEYRLPSVVALKEYVAAAGLYGTPSCNLHNLYVRDRGLCQYSGRELKLHAHSKDHEATMDHVIPRSQQGRADWDNVVLASWRVNNLKGNKRLEQLNLQLLVKPWAPTGADLLYLWLTEERLAALPTAWHEYLHIKPTPRLQRVMETLAQAA